MICILNDMLPTDKRNLIKNQCLACGLLGSVFRVTCYPKTKETSYKISVWLVDYYDLRFEWHVTHRQKKPRTKSVFDLWTIMICVLNDMLPTDKRNLIQNQCFACGLL